MAGKNFIKGAIKHPGAFKKKAQAAGKTTAAFAAQVSSNPSQYSPQTVKQANLAKTLMSMHHGAHHHGGGQDRLTKGRGQAKGGAY